MNTYFAPFFQDTVTHANGEAETELFDESVYRPSKNEQDKCKEICQKKILICMQ